MRYSVCREYNKILLKQMLVNAIVVEAGGFSAHVERTRDSQWSEYPKEYCFAIRAADNEGTLFELHLNFYTVQNRGIQ